MGYYTRYELEVFVDKEKSVDILNKMISELEYDKFYPFEYSLEKIFKDITNDLYYQDYNRNFELECSDECKWYDHEEEMRDLSKLFPTTLFKLHGEGEENGDIWNKYFLNSKMQECYAEMLIPPYDESKLR